jgi:hypothetical protein
MGWGFWVQEWQNSKPSKKKSEMSKKKGTELAHLSKESTQQWQGQRQGTRAWQ